MKHTEFHTSNGTILRFYKICENYFEVYIKTVDKYGNTYFKFQKNTKSILEPKTPDDGKIVIVDDTIHLKEDWYKPSYQNWIKFW